MEMAHIAFNEDCSGVAMNDSALQRLLADTEDVLEHLEASSKREYETAKEIVPSLVAEETPLIAFLRTENRVPQKAARRLTLYWKHRKQVFGERWLLPMVQTGRGAMTLLDIEMLRTGWGNIVWCEEEPFGIIDMSKMTGMSMQAERENWDLDKMYSRCMIYWTTIFRNHEPIQTEGVTIVHVVNSNPRPQARFQRFEWDIVQSSMPIKIKRILVVQAYENGKERLLDFMRSKTAGVLAYNCNNKIPMDEVHGDSVGDLIRQLERSGMRRNIVPVEIGGDLSLDEKLAEWTRTQLSLEEMMSVVAVPQIGAGDQTQLSPLIPTRKAKHCTFLKRNRNDTEETEIEFVKKRNALYSRRAYHKVKLGLMSLEEEVKKWKDANKKVSKENDRLEGLLGQAMAIVNCLCQPSPVSPAGQHHWSLLNNTNRLHFTDAQSAGAVPNLSPNIQPTWSNQGQQFTESWQNCVQQVEPQSSHFSGTSQQQISEGPYSDVMSQPATSNVVYTTDQILTGFFNSLDSVEINS